MIYIISLKGRNIPAQGAAQQSPGVKIAPHLCATCALSSFGERSWRGIVMHHHRQGRLADRGMIVVVRPGRLIDPR